MLLKSTILWSLCVPPCILPAMPFLPSGATCWFVCVSVCPGRALQLHQRCCCCLGGRGQEHSQTTQSLGFLWSQEHSGSLSWTQLATEEEKTSCFSGCSCFLETEMLHFKGLAQKSLCSREPGFSITGASVHHVCQLSRVFDTLPAAVLCKGA